MDQVLEQLHDPDIEHRLTLLSRHQLDRLRKTCSRVITRKYAPHKLRKPLYSNLTREFTRAQVVAFFAELRRFRNRDVTTAFLKQFFYGLRIGEINDARIVPGGLVRITNHKDGGSVDYLPLIKGTEELFRLINHGKGYSSNYLRKYFTETCDRLGDDFMYRYATDARGRLRRQFSTHSLRKTAGNLLRTHTRDPFKEAVFLRHETRALFGVTAVYMHYPLEQMRRDVNAAFAWYVKNLLR